MVEVSEAMGVTQTDLTPLFENRAKESPSRPTPSIQKRSFQRPSSVVLGSVPRAASQLRHKSLNTLLGGSRTPIGKAMPMQSPYQVRREKENGPGQEPAAKRQKLAEERPRPASPPNRALITLERPHHSIPRKLVPDCARPVPAKRAPKPSRPIVEEAPVITLDSEPELDPELDDSHFSDVTLPNESPRVPQPPRVSPPKTKSVALKAVVKPTLPKSNTTRAPVLPRAEILLPNTRAANTPKKPAPPSSPPVSASSRIFNVDLAVKPSRKPEQALQSPSVPSREPKVKSLRLSTGVKRGTLLCQSLPQQKRVARTSKRSESGTTAKSTSRSSSRKGGVALEKKDSVRPATITDDDDDGLDFDFDNIVSHNPVASSPPGAGFQLSEDPEVVHGIMDQQLLAPSIQPKLRDKQQRSKTSERRDESQSRKASVTREHAHSESPSPVHQQVPARTIFKRVQAGEQCKSVSRFVSPSDSVADLPSKPSKLPQAPKALSTGGFKKKTKRTQNKTDAGTGRTPADEPLNMQQHEAVFLPSAPSPAPRLTTIAAALQPPVRQHKPIAPDPIESTQLETCTKSPNRSFRRVRSANDAPIPSTADEWEARNLPSSRTSNSNNDGGSGKTGSSGTNVSAPTKKRDSGLAALTRKTDPRKKFKRTLSLGIDTSAASTSVNTAAKAQVEVELKSPVIDKDVGPWSTEAGDLFDWRPPGRDVGIDSGK